MHWAGESSARCVQIEEKRRAEAMAAADKAEKKLALAREELARVLRVTQHASVHDALADRFRFDSSGNVTEECTVAPGKDGAWEVRASLQQAYPAVSLQPFASNLQ
jgi:hypothetical protein